MTTTTTTTTITIMIQSTNRTRRAIVSPMLAVLLGAGIAAGAVAQSTPRAGTEDPCIAIAAGTPVPGMMGPGPHAMMGTPGAGMGSGMMDGTPGAGMGGMMGQVDPRTADVVFIEMMIPHHESAITMARVAETRAEHPRLQEMARQIVADQEAEIAEMTALRDTLPGGSMPMMDMDQMESHMTWMMDHAGSMGGMMHDGMTDGMNMDMDMDMAGMASLCEAEPFDLAFIDQMIPHHEGAVMMAQGVIASGESAEVKEIAERIVTAQETEIAEMEAIRAELGGGTPQP